MSPTHTRPPSQERRASSYRVKASVLRGYLKWLEGEGRLADALSRMAPDTAHLCRQPPLASTWMDSLALDDLIEQIEAQQGIAGVKRAAADILRTSMSPVLTPMVSGVLRIVGGSPHTLYRYWNDFVKTVMDGVEWKWTRTSETSGVFAMRYLNADQVIAMRTFCSTIAGLEYGLALAGRSGVVDDPVRTGDHSCSFSIHWV